MIRRGYIPQVPVTIVTENGDEAMIAEVKATAEQGVTLAQNARQMVLNRDARLAGVEESTLTLQQLADDYRTRVAESATDRADLRAQISSLATDMHDEAHDRADSDAANQVALSALRADLDRIHLTPGPKGDPGRDGQTGATGRDGVAGAAGKDFDPAIAAAINSRVATLEGATRIIGFGLASTPGLALLATVDITVTLSRQMPSTDYAVETARAGGITVDMLTVKAKTRTTVTYTLKAAVALGASVIGTLAYYP